MHLFVDEIGPEFGGGSEIRIGRQQWRFMVPDMINVLDDDEGFADRLAVVDEDGDLLVNRVHLEESGGFVGHVLLSVLEIDALDGECGSHSHSEHAHVHVEKNHRIRHCFCCSRESREGNGGE